VLCHAAVLCHAVLCCCILFYPVLQVLVNPVYMEDHVGVLEEEVKAGLVPLPTLPQYKQVGLANPNMWARLKYSAGLRPVRDGAKSCLCTDCRTAIHSLHGCGREADGSSVCGVVFLLWLCRLC
jgi:hypothetical protein